MTTVLRIQPDPDCRYCHGLGTVTDWVPYGTGDIPMPSDCDCVLTQLPDEDTPFEIDDSALAERIASYHTESPG